MGKAVIAGMGIQGVPIVYGMHALHYEVTGIDLSEANLANARAMLNKFHIPVRLIHGDATNTELILDHPDILISALPFHLNSNLAKQCIQKGIRYCDLGGNIAISDAINALAEKSSKVPVMTDLGLAPGIANIIAEIGVHKLGGADLVKIRVGGLPVNPKGTLKYGLTFSPQGLYNEYHEKCYVLHDGLRCAVEPLTDIEGLSFDGIGGLEAFNTSGGIAGTLDSMLKADVKECDYKTIRFAGHCELIRFLLFELRLTKQVFEEGIVRSCGFITDDQVIMVVEVGSGHKIWEKRCRILHDETFTAMQKATGFGTAAVAAIIGTGKMDGVRSAKYADVPHDEFTKNIEKLIPELELRR